MSCTLKMGAVYSFELFIHFYQTTWQLNLVDSDCVQAAGFTFMWPFKSTNWIHFFNDERKLLWF